MRHTTPTTPSLESISTDQLLHVSGGCKKHHRNKEQSGEQQQSSGSGDASSYQGGNPWGGMMFAQIMQLPPQFMSWLGQQQSLSSQSSLQSESSGTADTSVQVTQ